MAVAEISKLAEITALARVVAMRAAAAVAAAVAAVVAMHYLAPRPLLLVRTSTRLHLLLRRPCRQLAHLHLWLRHSRPAPACRPASFCARCLLAKMREAAQNADFAHIPMPPVDESAQRVV